MPVKLAMVVVGGAAIFAVLQLCWYVFGLVKYVKLLGLRKEREKKEFNHGCGVYLPSCIRLRNLPSSC